MRVQLRPFHTDEKLASIYPTPHHHSGWPDHRQRVRSTIALAGWFDNCQSVADLSCGDGTIIDALDIPVKYKGDYAPGYDLCGSIDETIDLIPKVDLFILSETIEHLVDPDATLAKIRAKTRYLVLSTPNGEDNAGNVEHYWGWDGCVPAATVVWKRCTVGQVSRPGALGRSGPLPLLEGKRPTGVCHRSGIAGSLAAPVLRTAHWLRLCGRGPSPEPPRLGRSLALPM